MLWPRPWRAAISLHMPRSIFPLRRCDLCWAVALTLFCGGYSSTAQPASRTQVQVDTPQKPWSRLAFNNNPDHFQFVVVSDRTGGARPGVFEDGIRKINLLQPEF